MNLTGSQLTVGPQAPVAQSASGEKAENSVMGICRVRGHWDVMISQAAQGNKRLWGEERAA